MENVLGNIAIIAISFPISYFLARACLRGVIRLMTGSSARDVL